MKQNNNLRALILVIALTLITVNFVAGTFARYTTQANLESTTNIAYWGFTGKEASLDISNLFEPSYKNSSNKITVQSSNPNINVIAPGTEGSAEFSFPYGDPESIGTPDAPEVAYDFMVNLEGSYIDPIIKNNKNILWSLNGKTDDDYGGWDEFMTDILHLSGHTQAYYTEFKQFAVKDYEAGSLPDHFSNNNLHTIKWKWEYTDDQSDSNLGNITSDNPVNLKISISAIQSD